MKKICLVSVFSAVLAVLATGGAVAAPDEVLGIPSITDGDSIRIGNHRIRIHGIEVPERWQSYQSAQGEDRHCGHVSTRAVVGQRPAQPFTV